MAINVFTFSGNCGQDMVVRHTPNGKAIGQVNVPCKTGWGDNAKVSWIQCKVFGERAEKIAPYLTQGKAVTVTGRFQLDEWEKDGVKHSRPTCLVNDIEWATPSQQANGNQSTSQGSDAGGGFSDLEEIPFAQHERGFVV